MGKPHGQSRSNSTQIAQPFAPHIYAIGHAYEHMHDRKDGMVTKPKLITFQKISRKYCLRPLI